MKKAILLFLCCLPVLAGYPQQNKTGTGLVYGTDYAFLLTAPKGWILDNQAGQSQRLSAVFYPKGESWDSATTAMYTSTWTLKPGETVDTIMKDDAHRLGASAKNIRVKPDVVLDKYLVAHVREILGDPDNNYEEIAYITQRNFIVVIVMTSRNKKDFDKKLPKFYELLKSYKLSMQKNE